MKYGITRLAPGPKNVVPIERIDFESIRDATKALVSLLLIESDYDILLSNYIDLEKAALSLAVESFVRAPKKRERAHWDQDHRFINRMTANLLSSARAFIDHTKRHVCSIPGCTGAERDAIRHLFDAERERSLSYRVIEALRNYAQHYGLPSQSISFGFRWVGSGQTEEEERLLSYVSPSLLVEYLRSDPKFQKLVLDELEASHGKDVPLLPLVREYVSSLSSINDEVRRSYRLRKNTWCEGLEKWAGRCPGEGGIANVVAVVMDERDNITDEIHLGLELRRRLDFLENTNRRLTNLHKLQVIN